MGGFIFRVKTPPTTNSRYLLRGTKFKFLVKTKKLPLTQTSGPRTLLGFQSAKPKHLKGKKNKKFPWVWGLRPQTQGNFFAFQVLRHSGLAAQQCPRPTGHTPHCYVYCSLYYFPYYRVLFNFEGGGDVLKYESPIRDSIRIKCKLCLFLP